MATSTEPTLRIARPVDRRIGSTLHGRYCILERIASGGMGIVYRAERVGLGRANGTAGLVAIKFLRDIPAERVELRRRFAIEARAASRLCHPNCVSVIDFGVDGDIPYLVMPFAGGASLRDLLADGPLPIDRTLQIARQVLAGLAHAHAHGVIHRDVKPENILVWSDATGDHAQLADFGLAKLGDSLGISQDLAIGSPSYMSPEQTLGLPVDARSDVYSAGVLLFELLTDVKPFHTDKPFDTMVLHREAPVPAFAEVAPERHVPRELESVVRMAMAKDPDDRFASAEQLARALELAAAYVPDLELADHAPRWLPRLVALIALAMIAITIWLASSLM